VTYRAVRGQCPPSRGRSVELLLPGRKDTGVSSRQTVSRPPTHGSPSWIRLVGDEESRLGNRLRAWWISRPPHVGAPLATTRSWTRCLHAEGRGSCRQERPTRESVIDLALVPGLGAFAGVKMFPRSGVRTRSAVSLRCGSAFPRDHEPGRVPARDTVAQHPPGRVRPGKPCARSTRPRPKSAFQNCSLAPLSQRCGTNEAAEFEGLLTSQLWLILGAVIAVYIVLRILYYSTIDPRLRSPPPGAAH